jgi:hypothetical protein
MEAVFPASGLRVDVFQGSGKGIRAIHEGVAKRKVLVLNRTLLSGGGRMRRQPIQDGEEVDFDVIGEDWNTYQLKDGTILKVKLVLAGVVRLKNKYDPLGNPVYMIKSTNVVRVMDVPGELKRKPTPSSTPTV